MDAKFSNKFRKSYITYPLLPDTLYSDAWQYVFVAVLTILMNPMLSFHFLWFYNLYCPDPNLKDIIMQEELSKFWVAELVQN